MLAFLSCLSLPPGNPDSAHEFKDCQNQDLPDFMILRIVRCWRFSPVYPSILETLIQTLRKQELPGLERFRSIGKS